MMVTAGRIERKIVAAAEAEEAMRTVAEVVTRIEAGAVVVITTTIETISGLITAGNVATGGEVAAVASETSGKTRIAKNSTLINCGTRTLSTTTKRPRMKMRPSMTSIKTRTASLKASGRGLTVAADAMTTGKEMAATEVEKVMGASEAAEPTLREVEVASGARARAVAEAAASGVVILGSLLTPRGTKRPSGLRARRTSSSQTLRRAQVRGSGGPRRSRAIKSQLNLTSGM